MLLRFVWGGLGVQGMIPSTHASMHTLMAYIVHCNFSLEAQKTTQSHARLNNMGSSGSAWSYMNYHYGSAEADDGEVMFHVGQCGKHS